MSVQAGRLVLKAEDARWWVIDEKYKARIGPYIASESAEDFATRLCEWRGWNPRTRIVWG